MKRLELYGNNMADYHLVTDLLPSLARLYFLFGLNNEVHLSALQQAILLGVGLQVALVFGFNIHYCYNFIHVIYNQWFFLSFNFNEFVFFAVQKC